jgi:tetratricopeptide (TPR) repeat protein
MIARYDLAMVFLSLGDNQKAIYNLELLLDRYPDHASAAYQLGVAFSNLDWHHEAILNFKRVLEINPEDERAINMIRSLQEVAKEKLE